jgi:hypothetical protein
MRRLFICIVSLALVISAGIAQGQADVTVYNDALTSGWENWSWDTTVNLGATTVVQSGSNATAATFTNAWAGVYLRLTGSPLAAGYSKVRFWVNGGAAGGQEIGVFLVDEADNQTAGPELTLTANTWTQVEVPLAGFGSSADLYGLIWQDQSGAAQPTFYLDNIQITGGGVVPTPPPAGSVTLQVDANAGQHAISPNIYGLNFADPGLAADIRLPINRWGGNATTRYNWQNDTSNRASDWYFENIPADNPNPANLPNGSDADEFISANQATNTQTLLTIPMIGWTPKSRGIDCGFSVAKYGAQDDNDWQWRPDCGNGVYPNDTFVVGNDPTDTSVAIGPTFVTAWMDHIEDQFGAGAVRYYNLDNEPALWNSTHRDVFPNGLSYDELRDRTYLYGKAIKDADPTALTLGPVEYGWTGYFYSGKDAAQPGNWWENPIDRTAHGGKPLVQWYLEQMQAYEQNPAHPIRILDYFDLHYYPAAPGVTLNSAGNANVQALRLRTTRSLWDATYTDESWIGDASQAIRQVNLIPRMRDWVNTYYPGTRLAISEYNFGGLEHINGALTQADVLGIFGREGMDLATLWDPPTRYQPGAYAFRMYRNYDGTGGAFGETGVAASSSDQSKLSVYAATRADGALTIMVINKTGGSLSSPLTISNFSGSMAEVYRYSATNLNQIVRQADATVSSGSVSLAYPANSITLLVVKNGPVTTTTLTRNYFVTPQPTLTWASVSWVVGYEVEIARSDSFLPVFDSDSVAANSLSYQTAALDYGTWFWRVRAVKSLAPFDASEWSVPESFVVGSP